MPRRLQLEKDDVICAFPAKYTKIFLIVSGSCAKYTFIIGPKRQIDIAADAIASDADAVAIDAILTLAFFSEQTDGARHGTVLPPGEDTASQTMMVEQMFQVKKYACACQSSLYITSFFFICIFD